MLFSIVLTAGNQLYWSRSIRWLIADGTPSSRQQSSETSFLASLPTAFLPHLFGVKF